MGKLISGCAAFFLLALHAPTSANAQKLLVNTEAGKNLGLQIKSDTWSDSDPTYTDLSYRKLKANQGLLLNKKIGAFDYYYRLKVSVPTTLTAASIGCGAIPFFKALVTNLFKSESGMVVLNASISYEETIGGSVPLISSKAPMLLITKGAQAGQLTQGQGCFLQETPSVEFPNIRFEDYVKEVFTVNFDLTAGKADTSDFVNNLLSLFNLASTAASWNTLTSPQAAAASVVSQRFGAALQAAGSFEGEFPIDVDLKQGSMVQITIPGALKQTAIEIFPYKSASVIAQGKNLSPSSVLSNRDLGARSCTLASTSSGGCAPKTSPLMSIVLSDTIKQITPKDYSIPFTVFDPVGKPDLIFNLCQALRLYLDTELRLSTVDEMLVRWALSKQSGLQDALKNDAVLATMLIDKDKKPILNNGKPIAGPDVVHECWNKDDDKILQAVIVDGMKIKLLDH
jgi:hypothetical protein